MTFSLKTKSNLCISILPAPRVRLHLIMTVTSNTELLEVLEEGKNLPIIYKKLQKLGHDCSGNTKKMEFFNSDVIVYTCRPQMGM